MISFEELMKTMENRYLESSCWSAHGYIRGQISAMESLKYITKKQAISAHIKNNKLFDKYKKDKK
jgi:hypothetical protein